MRKVKKVNKKIIALAMVAFISLAAIPAFSAASNAEQSPSYKEVVPNWLANKFRWDNPTFGANNDGARPNPDEVANPGPYLERTDHSPLSASVERDLPSWIGKNKRAPVFWTLEGFSSSAGSNAQNIFRSIGYLGTSVGGKLNGGLLDFVVTDGWCECYRGSMDPNENGYPKYPYRGWKTTTSINLGTYGPGGTRTYPDGVSYKVYGDFCRENGMTGGVYYNPLWLKMIFVYDPDKPNDASAEYFNVNTTTPTTNVNAGWSDCRPNPNYNNPAYADIVISNTGPGSDFQKKYPQLAVKYPNGLPLREIIRKASTNWGLNGDGERDGVAAAGPQNSNGGCYTFQDWYIIDPFKPGAEEYVKGMITYFKDMGMGFIKCDFMRNNDESYGPMANVLALKWMREAAGEDFLISTANSRLRNFGEHDAQYADMIRICEDQSSWNRFAWGPNAPSSSSNERGILRPDQWRPMYTCVDAFNYFANLNTGDVILDGHQTRMGDYSAAELLTVLGFKILNGSGIQISGNLSTLESMNKTQITNPAMLSLINERFIAKPVEKYVDLMTPAQLAVRNDLSPRTSYASGTQVNLGNTVSSITGRAETQIYYGQCQNGDWVIGFFNREESAQTRAVSFADLGITGEWDARDLWTATSANPKGNLVATDITSYSESIPSRGCRILRLSPAPKHFGFNVKIDNESFIADIGNDALQNVEGYLVLAVYDDAGRLVHLETKEFDIPARDIGSDTFLTKPDEYADGYTVKAFCWDKNFVPKAPEVEIPV